MLLSFFSIGVFALAIVNTSNQSARDAQGQDPAPNYSIEFSAYKNRLVPGFLPHKEGGYSGNANATTELGNPVSFHYESLRNPWVDIDGAWQAINLNGYVSNNEPINGMTSILILKQSTSMSFGIYWSHNQVFTAERYRVFDGSTPQAINFNFESDLPNYFKLVALTSQSTMINTFLIFFSCQNNYRTLSVGDNAAYIGYVAGGGAYLIGSSVTITATPYQGNTFAGWYDGDVLVSEDNPYTFAMPDVDTHYTALFTRNYYTLTLEANDATKGSVSGGGSYAYGSHNIIVATANPGYEFIGWYQGETLKSNSASYQFKMPYNDVTLTAHFVTEYTLTLINTDDTLGTISGSGSYGYGTSVTITATPNEGMYFRSWQDANENVISRNASHTFKMPEYDLVYYAVFSTTLPLEFGDTYEFGSYPQSKVTDSALISTLTGLAGTLPDSTDSQAWTDYGYYISGSISSYMWYIDLINGQNEYRGVYFTQYRPPNIGDSSIQMTSNQSKNGYSINQVYWFKYEPILWQVLDVVDDQALLLSNLVLDSRDFHHTSSSTVVGETTYYSNNYEYSDIRAWLNDDFYAAAFSNEEKALIPTTLVNNGLSSTIDSYNDYLCADTNDKIFLLSSSEATSASYGLELNPSRKKAPSDYAKANGVIYYSGGAEWRLRTPIHAQGSYISHSFYWDGDYGFSNVYETGVGIVPALWLTL